MAFFSQINLDKEQVNNYYNKTARFHTAEDYFLHEFLDFPQFSPEIVSDSLCALQKESDYWENANQISISAECKSSINTANGLSVDSLMKFCFVGRHPEETVNSLVSQHAVSPPDDLNTLVFNTFDAFDYIEESGSSGTMGSRCVENDFHSGKLSSSAQCFGHSGVSFENVDVQSACQGDRKLTDCHDERLPSMNYCSRPVDSLFTNLTSQNNRFETAETVVDEKVTYDTGNEGINWSDFLLMTQQNNVKIPKEESCDNTKFSANTCISLPSVKAETCSGSQNSEYISQLDNSTTLLIGAFDSKSENSTQTDMNMPELQQATRSAGNTQLVERHGQAVNQTEGTKSTYRNMSEMSFVSLHQQTKLSLSTNLTNDQQNVRSQCYEFRNVMPTYCRVNTSAEHKCTTIQMPTPLPVQTLSDTVTISQLFSADSGMQNASCQHYRIQNVVPIPRRNKAATKQEYTISYLQQLPSESKTSSQLFSTYMANDRENASSQCFEFQNMPISSRINTATEHECTVQFSPNMPVSMGIDTAAEHECTVQFPHNMPVSMGTDTAKEHKCTVQFPHNMPVSTGIDTATEHECTVQFPHNMPVSSRINTATEHEGNMQSPSENTSSSQLFSAHITNDLKDAVPQCYELKNIPSSRRINTATEQLCTIQPPSESIASSELFSTHMLSNQQNTRSQCCEFQEMHTSSSRVNTLTEPECTEHVEQLPSENATRSRLSAYMTSDPQNPSSPCYKLQGTTPKASRLNTGAEHQCTEHAEQLPSENATGSRLSAYMTSDAQNPSSPCYKLQDTMPKASRLNTAAEHECTEHAEKSSEIITDSHFQGNKQKKINTPTRKSKTYMKVGKRGSYVVLPVNKLNHLMVRDLLSLSGNKEEASIKTMTEDFRNNKRRMLEQKLKRLNQIQ